MPSSPNAQPSHTTHDWEPRDLNGQASLPADDRPRNIPVEHPPLFEVSTSAGIPAEIFDPARAAAEATGYAAGWAAGMRAARIATQTEAQERRAQAEREIMTRRAEFARAADAVRYAAQTLSQQGVPDEGVDQLIVAAAFEIAEAIVGATLRDDATRGCAAVTRALALAPANASVTVALNPLDHATLTRDGLPPVRTSQTIELVSDPTLAPGDAVATCGATTIDARIAAGVARVRTALVS